jgi:hypothetical protein
VQTRLLDFDRTDPRAGMVTVEDAREQLGARLDEIEDHRRRHGQVCPTCSGSGIVARAAIATVEADSDDWL